MKKWILGITGCAVLALLLALLSVLSFKEEELPPPSAAAYSDVERQLEDGIAVSASLSTTQKEQPSSLIGEWKGRSDVLKWGEGDTAAWEIEVPAEGEYEVSLGYYPLEGNGMDIEFSLQVDGQPLNDLVPFTLNRAWRDASAPMRKTDGNDLRPRQIEQGMWMETKLQEPGELSSGTLKLSLSSGKHRFELKNSREAAMLDYLRLDLYRKPADYKSYVANKQELGKKASPEGFVYKVQAENAYLKSAAGIFPTVDRSSPLSEPYNPVHIRINTIGGSNWEVAGQWISWQLEVPEDGWYKIGMRYKQNEVKGAFVSRKIMIDDAVPFAEMEKVRFLYNTSWSVSELGNSGEEPYLFYLTKGLHELKMEVTLGDMALPLQSVQDIVFDLNQMYRKIVMITGVTPDAYRDYDLDKSVPELIPEFERLSLQLKDTAQQLDQLAGQQNPGSSTFRMVAYQLDSFIERPDTLPKRLDAFKSNITGLADWVMTIKNQPLELDYLYLASSEVKKPQGDANVFQTALHELRTFTGSFLQNYDSISADQGETNGKEPLDIWVGLGRDQAYVLNRMIEESFTPETGIRVNLNIVKDALVKAVMAGVGPDINLFTNRGDTMNLAIRGALEPLDEYEGFDELVPQYMDSAFVPYQYRGHTFAIPDEQVFFMMFTRDDVLSDLGLSAPSTWDDLMKIAPVLQNNNLQIGLPYESLDAYGLLNQGMGLLNLYPTLLMQYDSGVYNEEHTATRFHEQSAYQAFKQWTDFYNLYDYPLYKNDLNRFWSGEMPIVITSYKMYNTLTSAAPEIDGTWTMRPIPGVLQPDGEINHASAANGTAGIILKSAEHKDDAWTFMEWWNAPEIQSQFVKELENELGVLGRRTPANIEAFATTVWSRSEQEVLMNQWKQVQEVPELPGGYYTSRNIDNAFRGVVFQWENPREALYYWNKQINEEITRKRYEFGVKP